MNSLSKVIVVFLKIPIWVCRSNVEKSLSQIESVYKNIQKIDISEENEMFSELGKGIYVKGQLSKETMLVDVGNKILVPKTAEEIGNIVNDQIKKFDEVKKEIGEHVNQVNKELDTIMQQAHKEEAKGKKGSKKD